MITSTASFEDRETDSLRGGGVICDANGQMWPPCWALVLGPESLDFPGPYSWGWWWGWGGIVLCELPTVKCRGIEISLCFDTDFQSS